MGGVRLAGAAVLISLSLTTLVCAPLAVAAPGAKPTPSHKAPAPTVTKTKTETAKPPPPPCKKPQSYPASRVQAIPWAQQRLDFTNAWSITKGKGVTVAIVASGVNKFPPQLAGRVAKSIDLTDTYNTDCFGHGTQVAGIIAAQDERNGTPAIPFVGVAPDVRLISIKIQEGETSDDAGTSLARGIERAVQEGAEILIVAAAGNTDARKKQSEQQAYPASYPGVLSVGAVGQSGPLSGFSNTSSKVDVTAPGDGIVTTTGDGYVADLQGTSYSTQYVAGVAALVKAAKPGLSAKEILHRIVASADGSVGAGSGGGMVNPYAAVAAIVSDSGSPAATRSAGAQPIAIGGPPPVA